VACTSTQLNGKNPWTIIGIWKLCWKVSNSHGKNGVKLSTNGGNANAIGWEDV